MTEYNQYCQRPDHTGGYNYVKACKIIESNGSLVYVEYEDDGEREWIDYRDVEGWQC